MNKIIFRFARPIAVGTIVLSLSLSSFGQNRGGQTAPPPTPGGQPGGGRQPGNQPTLGDRVGQQPTQPAEQGRRRPAQRRGLRNVAAGPAHRRRGGAGAGRRAAALRRRRAGQPAGRSRRLGKILQYSRTRASPDPVQPAQASKAVSTGGASRDVKSARVFQGSCRIRSFWVSAGRSTIPKSA